MSNLPSRCCRRPSLNFVPFETPFCRYTCGTHCNVYQARGGSKKKPRKSGHRQCRPENDSSSNHGTQNPLCVCLCLCLCPDVHDQGRGQLAIASYDKVAQHRPKLQSIVTKGVRLITVFDEIQVWLHSLALQLLSCTQVFFDCESNEDGFRNFRNVWTLCVSLQPAFVLGLTATLRPCDEMFTANACGLATWQNVRRASCERPAVTATYEVYETEEAAICAPVCYLARMRFCSRVCSRALLLLTLKLRIRYISNRS